MWHKGLGLQLELGAQSGLYLLPDSLLVSVSACDTRGSFLPELGKADEFLSQIALRFSSMEGQREILISFQLVQPEVHAHQSQEVPIY